MADLSGRRTADHRRVADRSRPRTLARARPRLEDRLSAIRTPTWVVTGSADRVVPVSAPQALAHQIPGTVLIMLDGAGHLLSQRHARRLSATILSAAGVETVRSRPAGARGSAAHTVS